MSFIQRYLAFTKHQETAERVHRWVALSTVAGALERKVWIDRGFYTSFPNLYVFIIGPSGKVKKSTATAVGVNLLRELPELKLMSERMTAASLISQMARSGREFTLPNGKRTRQSALFAYGSELAVTLSEVFGTISELLTTFFDCQPNDANKPWIYETKGDGQIKIFGPCLNFLGASTPTWLVRSIPPSEMEGGFSSRVIFVVENGEPRRYIAFPENEYNVERVVQDRAELLRELIRIHSLSGPFRVTGELLKFGQAWYENYMRSIGKLQDIRFTGYYSRKFDTILKVAMVLSAAESDEKLIELKHFHDALDLLQDVEQSMFDAFGSFGENANAPLTDRVWRLIESSGKITHGTLLRHVRRDADHRRLTDVIEDLRRMGRVRAIVDTELNSVVYYALQGASDEPAKPPVSDLPRIF